MLWSSIAHGDSESARRDFFDQIAKERSFGAYELDIEVRGRTFTARGYVASGSAKSRVSEIARELPGIRTVDNQIVVSPERFKSSYENSVAATITKRVKSELSKEAFALTVVAESQHVILRGAVDTLEGAKVIERIAQEVVPDKEVVNELKVRREELSDSELTDRVLNALRSDPQIMVNDLKISVERGTVTISGSRSEHRSVDRILSTVIMVDGVLDVKSEIIIEGKAR